MNGAQQRQHRRATDTLAQVITETQGAVVERFEEMEASFAALSDKLAKTCADVDAVRRKLDVAFDVLKQCYQDDRNHEALTLWGRLRWLVRGL